MTMTKKQIVLLSPFLIIAINFGVASAFGEIIGKWIFIPIVLTYWILWSFFILRFGGIKSMKKWLGKPVRNHFWVIMSLIVGLIPLPLFIFHNDTLSLWTIWLPWITLALINPWIEEFYWRGLLLDYSKNWQTWISVFYAGLLFSMSHAIYGMNSELNSGAEILVSTFILGIVWGFAYNKTKSLRWMIFAHFLVDFFGLSAPAFLDLWEKGAW